MVPILATAACFLSSEAQTLEHGAFLLERIIITVAAAEPVAKVLAVSVIRLGLLAMDPAAGVRFVIGAEIARARGGYPRGSAVAGEVALLEDLDQGVLAVALDGARIAHASGRPRIRWRRWRRVARQAGKDVLAKGAKDFGAGVNTLEPTLADELDVISVC